ncbi:uncharacterized protein [Dermacentor andersoni]|nr:uncharacterized protein LOC129380552 isoform X3 [Dermacentor andersoni]
MRGHRVQIPGTWARKPHDTVPATETSVPRLSPNGSAEETRRHFARRLFEMREAEGTACSCGRGFASRQYRDGKGVDVDWGALPIAIHTHCTKDEPRDEPGWLPCAWAGGREKDR